MRKTTRNRALSAILAAAMILSTLSACGKQTESTAATAESTVAATTAAESTEESTAETEADSVSKDYTGGSPWLDSDILGNVTADTTADPKDDFYLATNLDWLKTATIKEGYVSNSNFSDASDYTLERAQALLSSQDQSGHSADLVYAYYNAYLNWEERNALGVEPLKEIIARIEAVSSLSELSALLCDPPVMDELHCFVSVANGIDLNDATRYIAEIGASSLLLGDSAEYKERTSYGQNVYDAYKRAAERMLERLGYETDEAGKHFEDVIALETLLAKGIMTTAETKQADYIQRINNVMTPEEAYALCESFPLEAYIKALGYDGAASFLVAEPDYFRTLDAVYTEENLEGLKDTILLNYILDSLSTLDREAEEILIEMTNTINGTTGNTPDEQNAYSAVESVLFEPLGQLYLEKYDASETKTKITALCEDIIAYYKKMLAGTEWLSQKTRDKAIEKLDNIAIHAAYPEQWNDYSALDLKGLSYFDCNRAINEFYRDLNRSRTNQTVDRDLWGLDILQANAYYNSQNNSINIILGLLNGSFYSDEMSDEELYGAIGAVIGHEISHAFDTSGAQFDKDGNLNNWWTDEDYQAFTDRADKLAAYYDTISPWEGEHVRGSNIKTEAIADMAGIKCMLAIASEKEGFDYKRFFTTHASLWRSVNTPEFNEYVLTQDSHPLDYLRPNVNLQQYDEFYKTYDIQEGDGMYLAPEDRINVW